MSAAPSVAPGADAAPAFDQLPDSILVKLGTYLNPATQARFGQAMGQAGAVMCLGARQNKAATILQSLIRTSDKLAPFLHWKWLTEADAVCHDTSALRTIVPEPLWTWTAGARRSNALRATLVSEWAERGGAWLLSERPVGTELTLKLEDIEELHRKELITDDAFYAEARRLYGPNWSTLRMRALYPSMGGLDYQTNNDVNT